MLASIVFPGFFNLSSQFTLISFLLEHFLNLLEFFE